jgi:hypothetical protein
VRYAVVASGGVWRSLVARFVRDEEAVGSNPATPTQIRRNQRLSLGQARRLRLTVDSPSPLGQVAVADLTRVGAKQQRDEFGANGLTARIRTHHSRTHRRAGFHHVIAGPHMVTAIH